MITCKLGGREYTVDFIKGRALREIGPAADMFGKVNRMALDATEGKPVAAGSVTVQEAMDVLVKWFCLAFGNQFTPDDVYDNYPADRVIHDISITLMAVQTQTTEVLHQFPFPTTGAEAKM